MDNVDDEIRPAIQQHDVPANDDMRAIRRRRRQPPFQFFRTRLNALLQSWRERAAAHQLLFQSRRQAISFCKSWREITGMMIVPIAHSFAVAVLIEVFTLIVVAVFVVALSFSLGHGLAAGE
jgi:hypothetical protein